MDLLSRRAAGTGLEPRMARTKLAERCRDARLTLTPCFFMDIKSAKPKVTPPTLDQQLKKAAKMYEQQFLQEMMNAMNSTVDAMRANPQSMAEKIYKAELDQQYTEQWVENGGNGLADQIYRELKEKLMPAQHNRYQQAQKPETGKIADGPVPSEKIKK